MLNKNIRRCAHIKTNGTQCGSPAARGHELCYFHWRAAKDFPRRRSAQPIPEPVIDLTLIDGPDAIHYALMQIAQGVANGTLTDKQSGRLLWTFQVMSSNFKQTSFHRQLEDEYSSSNLNCYQIWDKIKQETEDQQRAELHEKRIEEINRLEKTCCKCHQLVDDESQLTSTAPAAATTDNSTPNTPTNSSPAAPTNDDFDWPTEDQSIPEIKACSSDADQPETADTQNNAKRTLTPTQVFPRLCLPFVSVASFALKSAFQFIRSSDPSLRWLDGSMARWPDHSMARSHHSHTEPNSFKSSVIRTR